ncbi:hypothetical protein [Pelomonas cellulosilytica]|uniref:Uncharacterized protein n=1 Tax=Pelomonas cellulosilytica TaxID=2906762 RepID=A0ABS8Y0E8_9BURK|nr:hypothetical protein [Pelomonas sp. P8]MCE4557058.1 hypothetical protein [Pelomonas sp. P8]
MQAHIKSAFEYAVITLLALGLCLWQFVSSAQAAEPPAGKLILLALGLLVAGAMHCVFMMQLVRSTGRAFWPWLVAVVVFMPIGSAVLLALLLAETDVVER